MRQPRPVDIHNINLVRLRRGALEQSHDAAIDLDAEIEDKLGAIRRPIEAGDISARRKGDHQGVRAGVHVQDVEGLNIGIRIE